MRILLTLWAAPLALFWGWYGLSAYDLSFGTRFLSREVHDVVFDVYGRTLGMAARDVPGAIASACAFDTAVIMAIVSWRWRESWLPQTRAYLIEFSALLRRRWHAIEFPRF